MANEQNLIPLNQRSQRERKEIAIKGANASNKIQKEKKRVKQQFELLMSLDLQENELKEQIKSLGIPEEEINVQMALCVAMTQQALQGNIKAFELIRDTIGQNPINELENEKREMIIFIDDLQDIEEI